jgi:hypothetical protein
VVEVPARFTRDYGCTEVEWLRWLPDATAPGVLTQPAAGIADVSLPGGQLRLSWQALPPRRIALISLPRLEVRFDFTGLGPDQRRGFMRSFDLHTQRGGG